VPAALTCVVATIGSARREQELANGVGAEGAGGFTDAYFGHPGEVRPLMEGAVARTLDLIACEGIVGGIEEGVNALSGEAWQAWVDVNYRLARDPSVHGAASHLLYVGRRP
jgi:hypothetical protein